MDTQQEKPKNSTFKHWWFWTLIAIATLIIGASLFAYFVLPLSIFPTIDGENPPKFIQADFVELDKVFSISKYRSGVGHDYSDSDESCRSMKHYFSSMDINEPNHKTSLKDVEWPRPVEGKDVTIFSPVDGRILMVQHQKNRGWMGDEIKIVPDAYPKVLIRLMHVTPIDDTIRMGKKVKAGEKVGLVLANQSFDISIDQNTIFDSQNISYFAAMPDNIFAKYQARGIESRDELIVTKEYRDAHPFQCDPGTEQFVESSINYPGFEKENYAYLSGYDQIYPIIQNQWNNIKNQKKDK